MKNKISSLNVLWKCNTNVAQLHNWSRDSKVHHTRCCPCHISYFLLYILGRSPFSSHHARICSLCTSSLSLTARLWLYVLLSALLTKPACCPATKSEQKPFGPKQQQHLWAFYFTATTAHSKSSRLSKNARDAGQKTRRISISAMFDPSEVHSNSCWFSSHPTFGLVCGARGELGEGEKGDATCLSWYLQSNLDQIFQESVKGLHCNSLSCSSSISEVTMGP